MSSNISFEIKIVFDNRCYNSGFLTGFGFSALIHNNLRDNFLLFDTGGNGTTLIHNIRKFNLKISQIENVIISHNHGDHAGGLKAIYQLKHEIKIYVPVNHLESFRRAFPEATIFGILEMKELDKNVFSSGLVRSSYISEQALFLKTIDGKLIILVGCSHPGLEHFILKGKKIGDIKAIIGGFHGFNKFSYLEDIDFIGACHCTQHINDIKKLYPSQFRKICVGDSFNF